MVPITRIKGHVPHITVTDNNLASLPAKQRGENPCKDAESNVRPGAKEDDASDAKDQGN
jgi:hypothetical protein